MKSFKLLSVLLILTVAVVTAALGQTSDRNPGAVAAHLAPASAPFSPSNARTEDGKLIPADQFFPAARCASCHQDTHTAWAESLHRNSAREPFYKESVDILEHTRGTRPMQHCESCHAPVAVFTGALMNGGRGPRPLEDEGVTCSVCHSITEARLDGTGSYTIRRPALLERADGTPVYGDVTDAAIMADVAGHKRAMMRPLLKQAEFCAVCHKSNVTPQLNDYKFLRGFSVYDEWQQSGASTYTVTPYYRRDQQADCRTCHMPQVESSKDASARDGLISSHRWIGANTITPLYYGHTKQFELTKAFLENKVISVDIFALRSEASGRVHAPLDASAGNPIALRPGEAVTAEVVVFNRKAAHSFPPELRDMYEPWVEFEALDANGKTIFHSGFIKADGTLDESAHVYKQILLDENARVITRHQMWAARVKAYDNWIPPGRSDVARFRFTVPAEAGAGDGAPIKLRARVNYRRFIQEYTEHVLRKYKAESLQVPIVRMAEAEVTIVNQQSPPRKKKSGPPPQKVNPELLALRWNDYGIGLMEQAQYGPASEAFRRAAELNPKDPNPLVSAAVAELKTEQFGLVWDQLRKAAELLNRALKINPNLARTRFYHALLLRSQGKGAEAADELMRLAAEYPRDREVARQLGQTLYSLGRVGDARGAFESILLIDPTDAGAYQFLAPIYASEGRSADADLARARYLLWRDDPLADIIGVNFFAANPQWTDERVLTHTHGHDSPPRPTLTGLLASPVR
ncbi:MAG TPA: multiheme c-type cytochrome [Pyrinomonadaceae bacterium]|nr:multiheme c-type cytochrome [Pyrinomonadaceae bacterium]